MGRYLEGLIDRVFAWGGDVEKLYGDAFLAFWPVEADREAALRSALKCASEMVARYDDDGRATDRHCVSRRWWAEDFHRGSGRWPIRTVALFHSGAEPIQSFGHARRCAAGKDLQFRRSAINVSGAAGDSDPGANRRRGKDGDGATDPLSERPSSEAFLRAFLPAPLRRQDWLHAEWLAEFRWVAMVAVGVTDLRCDDEIGLAATQSVVTMLQDCADQFDGTFTSFTMSDKGPLAVVAFGLQGQAHDDDAARAVRLAHKAQAALAEQGAAGRAAVTFGLAYCGVIGNPQRKDYAIIGDAINRAAKLVSRKDAPSLACDRAIAEKAGQWIAFEPLAESEERDAPLFRPVLEAKAPSRRLASFRGRETEMAWLRSRLGEIESGRAGLVLYVEGEAGIGKSTLASALAELARDRFVFLSAPLSSPAPPRRSQLGGRSLRRFSRRPCRPMLCSPKCGRRSRDRV